MTILDTMIVEGAEPLDARLRGVSGPRPQSPAGGRRACAWRSDSRRRRDLAWC